MKKLTKAKNIIIFILVLSMLCSFTACAKKTQAQGSALKISAKGINTKTLKLTVSGTFPEGTSLSLSYTQEEKSLGDYPEEIENTSIVPVISVTEKSVAANKAVYIITGLQEGHDSLIINFVKDDISYSKITATVTIGEDMKILDCQLNLRETQDKYILAGGLETDSEDDRNLEFELSTSSVYWRTLGFDENLVSVSGPYYNNGTNTATWLVEAVSPGNTQMVLANDELGKKISVAMEIYESEGSYSIRLLSSEEGDYNFSYTEEEIAEINTYIKTETITEEDGTQKEVTSSAVYLENLYVPGDFYIKEADACDTDSSKPVFEMTLEKDGAFMYVRAFGESSLASVRSDVTDAEIRKTLQEMTLAGIDMEYYNAGVDKFLFEKDGVIYDISFADDLDFEAHKAVIEKYLQ